MKRHSRLFSLLLAVSLTAALPLTAAGASGPGVSILVSGVPLRAAESAYITESGVTMVPLRALSEALGFSVGWDQESRTVSVLPGGTLPDSAPRSAVIALDPGHGGSSTGAGYGGISEKDLNLSIAKQTAAILEGVGMTIIMTRTSDQDVGLYDRTVLAERQGAELFVSIHCNASETNPAAAGIYTAAFSRESAGWALSEHLRQSMTVATGAADMGAEERPDLAVLRTAAMPAALVECGFMSTPEELELLIQPDYQVKLAAGIAGGVLAYLEQNR